MRWRLGSCEATVEQAIAELTEARAAERILAHDATLWGGDAARQASVSNRLGWMEAPVGFHQHIAELEDFAAEVRAGGFTSIVVLGMGGSSLAPDVLGRCLSGRRALPLHVLDSTDPATIAAVEGAIDAARTLFFVSSKSGGTIEVATLFAYFHALVDAATLGNAGQHFAAITDAGTQLESLAAEHGFRRTFINPADIGGRYSALSYFGLAPAAAAGIDVRRLLERAVAADDADRARDAESLRLGAALGAMARTGRDKLTLMIAPELAPLATWLEQLIAESTGKDGRGIVPIVGEPAGAPPSYASDRFFVQVRLASGASGDHDSLVAALVAEGHPAVIIDLASPSHLGAEFVRWEIATAVAGMLLDVNPFDEPNVQESKDNTARILAQGDVPARAASHEDDFNLAIDDLIDALPEHGYLAINAFIQETPVANAVFGELRARLRDATGAATTLGYGPRYLHSTGQLHKGGPASGVFLQVTADDPRDLRIPGRAYSFGQLKRAQAIGDYESLQAHGRPLRLVHLGADVEAGLRRLLGAGIRATSAVRARR